MVLNLSGENLIFMSLPAANTKSLCNDSTKAAAAIRSLAFIRIYFISTFPYARVFSRRAAPPRRVYSHLRIYSQEVTSL